MPVFYYYERAEDRPKNTDPRFSTMLHDLHLKAQMRSIRESQGWAAQERKST